MEVEIKKKDGGWSLEGMAAFMESGRSPVPDFDGIFVDEKDGGTAI